MYSRVTAARGLDFDKRVKQDHLVLDEMEKKCGNNLRNFKSLMCVYNMSDLHNLAKVIAKKINTRINRVSYRYKDAMIAWYYLHLEEINLYYYEIKSDITAQ